MMRPPTRFQQQQNAIMAGVSSGLSDQALSDTAARAKAQFAAIPSIFDTPAEAPQDQQASVGAHQLDWSSRGKGGSLNDSWSQVGLADNVPRSLITTESSGNWGADNGLGYHGLMQFGPARYADVVRAGVVPAGMTIEQFGSNTPEGRAAQVAATNWHFNDIDSRIKSNGYDRLVGQTIGGVPITMDAMRSIAHLGGFGGLSNFIQSGGTYNLSDAFGTSLAAYGQTHR